jgi:hypothetical protein
VLLLLFAVVLLVWLPSVYGTPLTPAMFRTAVVVGVLFVVGWDGLFVSVFVGLLVVGVKIACTLLIMA